MVKNASKNVLEEVSNNNKEEAVKELKQAEKVISRVAGKGVLHRRAASRKISSLSRKVNQLSAT